MAGTSVYPRIRPGDKFGRLTVVRTGEVYTKPSGKKKSDGFAYVRAAERS